MREPADSSLLAPHCRVPHVFACDLSGLGGGGVPWVGRLTTQADFQPLETSRQQMSAFPSRNRMQCSSCCSTGISRRPWCTKPNPVVGHHHRTSSSKSRGTVPYEVRYELRTVIIIIRHPSSVIDVITSRRGTRNLQNRRARGRAKGSREGTFQEIPGPAPRCVRGRR